MKKVSKKVLQEGIKRINAQIAEMSDLNAKLSKQLDKVEKDTGELKKAFRSLDKELARGSNIIAVPLCGLLPDSIRKLKGYEEVLAKGFISDPIEAVNEDIAQQLRNIDIEKVEKEIMEGSINHVEGKKGSESRLVNGVDISKRYRYIDKLYRYIKSFDIKEEDQVSVKMNDHTYKTIGCPGFIYIQSIIIEKTDIQCLSFDPSFNVLADGDFTLSINL